MPTWRQLQRQEQGSLVAYEGLIDCQKACVVRRGAALDSEHLGELAPETRVRVEEAVEASGRQRLRLSEPLEGWVTAKYVRRAEWQPPRGRERGVGPEIEAKGIEMERFWHGFGWFFCNFAWFRGSVRPPSSRTAACR